MNKFFKGFFIGSFISVLIWSFIVLVVFSISPYFKTENNISINSVKPADTVDEVVTFNSSNISLPLAVWRSNSWNNNYTSSDLYTFGFGSVRISYSSSLNLSIWYYLDSLKYNGSGQGNFVVSFSSLVYDEWVRYNESYLKGSYFIETGFDFNPISLSIIDSTTFRGNSNFYSTSLRYFDSNGKYMELGFGAIPKDATWATTYRLTDRTYYFVSQFNDNEYYQTGYINGYNTGESDGYDIGYADGESVGYSNGYYVGHSDGLTDSNVYSFGSLLSAVVSAPVSVFVDILDFDLMGFNLLSLVVGLLSFSIILLIIKLILGGK